MKSESSRKVLIFGDSQTASLKYGFDLLVQQREIPENLSISFQPLGSGAILKTRFFREQDGVAYMVNETIRRRVQKLPLDEQDLLYGFSGSLHTIRVLRDIDWSMHAPSPVAEREQPVSLSLLREIFVEDQQHMLAFLDILLRNGVPIFAIEAPLPFRHHPMFTRARSEVLLYIDREYRKFVRGELGRRGIPVVPVPPECVDEDGFMLARYKHPDEKDFHHGNAEFGEVMMRMVMSHLARSHAGTVPGELTLGPEKAVPSPACTSF